MCFAIHVDTNKHHNYYMLVLYLPMLILRNAHNDAFLRHYQNRGKRRPQNDHMLRNQV
jgi:hypothetical protein